MSKTINAKPAIVTDIGCLYFLICYHGAYLFIESFANIRLTVYIGIHPFKTSGYEPAPGSVPSQRTIQNPSILRLLRIIFVHFVSKKIVLGYSGYLQLIEYSRLNV